MIFEHEIPQNSKLYFGESAKLKRDIENKCATALSNQGFSEIVTPFFSYHQHDVFGSSKGLIRLNDKENSKVTLRADSTVDVVRIATKRLNRSSDNKKWFYIQPVFNYPTKEQYQVGAEIIGGEVAEVAKVAMSLCQMLDIDSSFQLANIAIANILVNNYGFDIEDIKDIHLEKILSSKLDWINSLVAINGIDDLQDLSIYPNDIAKELQKIANVANNLNNKNILISPLYYAPMRYYNSIVFRVFDGNELYLTGGEYSIKDVQGSGFALYIDSVIAKKI